MATRYFIHLSFKGTSYQGWQSQPSRNSIQDVIEDALEVILREEVKLTGAGRTDAGVHSTCYYAHFDSGAPDLDSRKGLINRINKYLPPDLAIYSIRKVREDAHARYSAVSRTYSYFLLSQKDPFRSDTAWFLKDTPDIEIMNEAGRILISYDDFTSFARLHSNAKTNLCRVYGAGWHAGGESLLVFTITANRFLRNMVRAIVGTMVDVGRGKVTLAGFIKIIEAKDRGKAGKSAPACGLFLTDIRYPEEIFI